MRTAAIALALGACSSDDPGGGRQGKPSATDTGTSATTGTTSPEECGDPSFTLGTGDYLYEPYPATNAVATVVQGGQGGGLHHVWVGADLVGFGPRLLQQSTVTLVDSGIVIAGDPVIDERFDLTLPVLSSGLSSPAGTQTACGWQFGGAHAFLYDNLTDLAPSTFEAICSLDHQMAEIDVTITDLDDYDRTLTASQTIYLESDPVDGCP